MKERRGVITKMYKKTRKINFKILLIVLVGMLVVFGAIRLNNVSAYELNKPNPLVGDYAGYGPHALSDVTNTTEDPMITVLTAGLAGAALHWSNNFDSEDIPEDIEFAYDENSLIEQLRNFAPNGATVFWAKMSSSTTFEFMELPVQQQMEAYLSRNLTKIERLTMEDLQKHMIIVFEPTAVGSVASNEAVYLEFKSMLNTIVSDVAYLTNGVYPKINLIGHSRGGLTNLQYALEHPTFIDGLFSIGTPYLGTTSGQINRMLINATGVGIQPDTVALQNILNPDIYEIYRDDWNRDYDTRYSHINAVALGSSSSFGYLMNVFEHDYKDRLNDVAKIAIEVGIAGLAAAFCAIHEKWWTGLPADILSWTAIQLQAEFPDCDILALFAVVLGEVVDKDPSPDTYYLALNNDGFVDLNSQLGIDLSFFGASYKGFVRVEKIYDEDEEFGLVSIADLPIAHNLQPRDNFYIEEILGRINVGYSPFEFEYLSNGEIEITGYSYKNYTGILNIPQKINGVLVKNIGPEAFLNCSFCEVVLPNSVVNIEVLAFSGCINLTSVIISESVIFIDTNAFEDCISLNKVTRKFDYNITEDNCYYLIKNNLNSLSLEVDSENVLVTNNIATLYFSVGNHSIKLQGNSISSVINPPVLEKSSQLFVDSNQNVKSSVESGKNVFYFSNWSGRFVTFTLEASGYIPSDYLENTIVVRDFNGTIKKFGISEIFGDAKNINGSNTVTVFLPIPKKYYIEVNFSDPAVSELKLTARLMDSPTEFNLFGLNGEVTTEVPLFNNTILSGDEIKVVNILQSGKFEFQTNSLDQTVNPIFVIIKKGIVNNQVVTEVFDAWGMDNYTKEVYLESGIYYIGYFNNIVGASIEIQIYRIITQHGSHILVTDPDYMTPCGSQINIIEADNPTKSYRQTFITEGFTRLIYPDYNYGVPASRLDYDWYSSNPTVATVTPYGTVLALPVSTDTTVKIMAVIKTDYSRVFVKEFTILNDIGLTCEYANREEMVNGFLDDYTTFYNTANGTNLSRVTLLLPGDPGYDVSTALVARLDNANANLELFFNNLNLYDRWIWIIDYMMEIRVSSQAEFQKYIYKTAIGTSAIVKYELWAFLSERVKTSWPTTSDYTIDSNANGFWYLINGDTIYIDIDVTIPADTIITNFLENAAVPINILQYYFWSTQDPSYVTFVDWGGICASSSAVGQTAVLHGTYFLNSRVILTVFVDIV